MNFLKLLPVILSILLLSAHFYRAGYMVLVFFVIGLLPVLFIRKPWAVKLIQAVLVLGGIEWMRTLVVLAQMRIETGAPWIRLALILGAVAVFTICSTFVFRAKSLKDRYTGRSGL